VKRLVVFLNELSCRFEDISTPEGVLAYVLLTISTLQAVRRLRQDFFVAGHLPLTQVPLGDGTQSLRTVLMGNIYKDHWRFLNNLDQSSPWGEYPGARVPGDLEGVSFGGNAATGMTWARKNDSAVFSFGHPPNWNAEFIHARFDRMNVAGDIESNPVDVPNLSVPDHANAHIDLIRNFGEVVSASSLVYDSGNFVVRMYFYDHNPPHFHVLPHRNTSKSEAKCAINTLDILEGDLPVALRREMRNWARTRRDELLVNWGRCQMGTHPFRLD
jgi:hypothetical protein